MGYLIILIILIALFVYRVYTDKSTTDAAYDNQTKALMDKIGASPDVSAEPEPEPDMTDHTAEQTNPAPVQ